MNRKHFVLLGGCIALLLVIFCFVTLAASETKFQMKLAWTGAGGTTSALEREKAAFAVVFKNLIEGQSNGQIQVEYYPEGILGNEREQLGMLKSGVIQMCISTVGGMSTVYPKLATIDIPFVFPNDAVAWKVLNGPFSEDFKEKVYQETGIRTIQLMGIGFYNITNNKKTIQSPEDMAGLKFRTMNSQLHMNLFSWMGAASVPVAWGETYTALQTGVADGIHNPVTSILNGKIYEVQKFLTVSRHFYGIYYVNINDAWYKSLPDEFKKAVILAARSAAEAAHGLILINESRPGFGFPLLEEKGVKIYNLTEEQRLKFRDTILPKYLEWIKEKFGDDGVEWVNRLIKAVEQAKIELEKI